MEGEKQEGKKYILIRADKTISYDNDNCYVNDAPLKKEDGDSSDSKVLAEEKKKEFYSSFFKKHYQNIVVLTAAGTSMDNGDRSGKTRESLWVSCKDKIDTFEEPIKDIKEKEFYKNKDIEDLLSHLILYKKVNKVDGDFDTKIKALEEEIATQCKLILHKEAPHKTFLNKITARKPSDSRVQLFTANYDTLFEQAANEAGFVVIDGFSFTHPRQFAGRHFDYDVVNRERTRLKQEDSFIKKVFHLYKLHGSLNWTKDQGGKIIQSDDTKSPLIIYPASEKYESSYEQPYFEMMLRFQQALRKDNVLLIVIGFGFKDKHIQNVILEAVEQNPSFQLVVISYDETGSIKGSGDNISNKGDEKGQILKHPLRDLFIDDKQEHIKRNVTIIFDTFKSFTENYPENHTYTEEDGGKDNEN